ncbi:unnamed protein product [Brachionus calyciflorus]|uniref:Lipase domain-containing protein n=1 Tax=Brachionus calyciflorus TaxID=104777 RepID=A0A814CC80_9BILA|nr:unnamed protein product [Brachionus calyciflorus]
MKFIQLYFLVLHILLVLSIDVSFYSTLSPYKSIILESEINLSNYENLKIYLALVNKTECKNYVIIHGFGSSGDDDWVLEMKDKLLYTGRCVEVLSMNWSDESTWRFDLNLGYVRSIEKIPSISQIFAKILINFSNLKNSKNFLKNLHCIGHSLGAHMCGFISKYIKEKENVLIKRISGLDPAGPCFETLSESNRLSKNDAEYVDVIHTSINLGIRTPIGHSDYYVNNARTQPGCYKTNEIELPVFWCKDSLRKDSTNRILSDVFDFVKCSHSKAHRYFIDSIMSRCKRYDAYRCDNYENFMNNKCYHCRTNKMGFYSEPEFNDGFKRNYYLDMENFKEVSEFKLIKEDLNPINCEPVYVKMLNQATQDEIIYLTLNNMEYLKGLRRVCSNTNCTVYILIEGYEYKKRTNSKDWLVSMKSELFSNQSISNILLIDWRDIQDMYKTKQLSVDYVKKFLGKLVENLSKHLSKGLMEFRCIGKDEMATALCGFFNKMLDENLEYSVKEYMSLDNFYCNKENRLVKVNFVLKLVIYFYWFYLV